jgi:hypothetical protein
MYFPALIDSSVRAFRALVRLALGMALFALISPAPAYSAPQPVFCPSAASISV